MAQHQVRSYDYVNGAYARVREVLVADPAGIFRDATRSSTDRARSLAAELHVRIAGVDVATEVEITTGPITHEAAGAYGMPVTHVALTWAAVRNPQFFPLMKGTLSISPLTPTETELDFQGHYEPPLGVVGGAIDTVLGHRVAEAAVHRFVADVAHHLRTRLTES
jgi:hypothetical protein